MTPRNGFFGKKESALRFLRLAAGISREKLAEEVGVQPDTIEAVENGCRWLPLCKMTELSDFFAVGCSTLLYDNLDEAAAVFSRPIQRDALRQQECCRIRQAYRERVGNEGEEWVVRREREKLKNTPYANAVNPNYANESSCHFDILSFTPNGECVYIEVKTTAGSENVPYFMTAAELKFLQHCIDEGKRYELHRVIHVLDPARRYQMVYTAQEVLEQFEMLPNSYAMCKRWEAA